MRWATIFIFRPVTTVLVCLAMMGVGALSLLWLPVSPLPEMELPIISVRASLPGASPETMASTVATPLEQALGSISGVTNMVSRSYEGNTQVNLEFDFNRDINAAARDVQAAINQARPLLPSGMRQPPSYDKVNPNSAPVVVLSMTSPTATQPQLFDLATTIVAQKLAQVKGVGEISVGGASLPAVRISLNPQLLVSAGIALDEVRSALAAANALAPNGFIEDSEYQWSVSSGRQLNTAAQIRPLIIAWRNGSAVRLQDVATVRDASEDLYNVGFVNDQEGVLLIVRRQADANIIQTVDAIHQRLPELEAMLPSDVQLRVAQDRTPSIRATLHEARNTLVIAVLLVIGVVLVFLQNWRAAIIPAIAVPASLISTFALMYWFGFSLNTISLMALIVATGFVVDDAIVVLESIMRHIERGVSPVRAAVRGIREVAFTVVAMSVSLVAVFLPMWLIGGLVGRLFKQFAVTLSVAVLLSLIISIILTPMMAARLLAPVRAGSTERSVSKYRGVAWVATLGKHSHDFYARSLSWALRHKGFTLLTLVLTIVLNGYLYTVIPKGLFPQQDTGQVLGFFRVDPGTSFEATLPKLNRFRELLLQDPAIRNIAVFAGGRGGNTSSMLLVELQPFDQREETAFEVVARLRPQLQQEPGARLFLTPQQDIFTGGGLGRAGSYQYSILGTDLDVLKEWVPKIRQAMATLPELEDVDTDTNEGAQQISLRIDRERAASLGVDMGLITGTLNNSFSQRQVSVVYGRLNQYNIVLGVQERFAEDLQSLQQIEMIGSEGQRIPLSVLTSFEQGTSPTSIGHQGLMVAESISFSLAEGVTLDQATEAINLALAEISVPTHQIQTGFDGTARVMRDSIVQQPFLIFAALITMYLVLGMLYESYIHPITILSTLPSAGIGALLALLAVGEEFSIIAIIGVFLLIGIVKKNAIMMVDYALIAERRDGASPEEAIYQACLVRFRPIMMTTISAILGALPLILARGAGVEMRQPLGLTIVGGLALSQILTIYTTPVVYLYLDRFRQRYRARRALKQAHS
ncbi:MAG TPA: efflux RND transporter permease subunit [Candidatus Paenalcaligenes intestinipullorum]|uniref:Efflux RND transporter permease subunit n=1 Tax=Candidatus Paenalcaligenes intestinipullorum TaxID=2838718 RepID=A0A9D2U9K8_9BURK|nr:efflux RND transporter permease subunit [Candidatus Paenalcaligenes intestinipullorum]